jgi:hypothetical protein
VGAARTYARDADAGVAIEAEVMTMTTSSLPDSPEAPALPPARCWTCGGLMTDLAVHPAGGPWICLTCKGETLEAARARHAQTGAAPVTASGETTAAVPLADAAEDIDPAATMDSVEDVESAEQTGDENVPF